MGARTEGGAERYRLVVSDGELFCQGMVATQSHHLIVDQQLDAYKIIRIKQYQKNVINKKRSVILKRPLVFYPTPGHTGSLLIRGSLHRILVVLDLENIPAYGVQPKIGDPKSIPLLGEEGNVQPISGTNFYGQKTEEKKSNVSMVPSLPSRPAHDTRPSANIYPIEALSPYTHAKWTIRARVTVKSDIKRWQKPTGSGKLFSVNFLDESGEIRCTGFNDQVDQFYDLLQTGQVYYISSPCKIALAKKQFSNLPNDYELTFDRETVIEKAEDQGSVPQVRFNFCSLGDLDKADKDSTVDVIGILKEVEDVTPIVSKTTNKPYDKRELTLVDDSGYSVRMTVWGQTATSFDSSPESVLAFRGVKVSDFGGRSLSLLSSGTMAVDPDIPDAHRLKGWYDSQGRNDAFSTHNNMASVGGATGRKEESKLIAQIKEDGTGMSGVEYFNLKATIVYIKQDNFAYPACANQGCNKKVTQMPDDTWRCEKCDAAFPAPEYRYIMSINVCDHTNQMWLSCFDDVGRMLMGASADEIMQKKEEGGDLAAAPLFDEANCRRFNFRCRAKMETFQEQEK